MKLEDAIQQKVFKSPQQKLIINLIYTHHWLDGLYSEFFKGKEITLQQFNVLRILRGQYPNYSNLKLIKERMLDRMSDTSRIIDKLVFKQYVERKNCPVDRRQIHLLITKKGLELLNELDFIDNESTLMCNNLTKKEVQDLNNLLDKLRQ
jgi:DNA-binding MarR family transcriptional regulator